ncbi:MAG TPA: Ig-like domain-containing protein [Nitrospirota bacterium]|nr:Ig-like domain-containing protein [Nitrospirota bacterium]
MLKRKNEFAILLASLLVIVLAGCGGGSSGTNSLRSGTTSPTAQLVAIEVTPTNPSIAAGTTLQFTATGVYSDKTTQDLTATVTWESSDSVDALWMTNGRLRGKGPCRTTISATKGSVSGSTTLTVTPATLASITVTPTNPSIAKGTTQQFMATGTFSDNTTQDLTVDVVWSSSASSIAGISNTAGSMGLVTAAAAGSTTITATSGTLSGSTTLMVKPATLVSVAITPTNPSIAMGSTQQFTATGTYSDGSTQNLTTAVTWSSSSSSIAGISNTAGSMGLATPVAAGSTTITATSGTLSGSTTLTVKPATLVSVAITPANPTVIIGTTQQLTATGTYSDGSKQNLTTTVTWSSSSTSVATISNAAGSKGLITPVAAGSTTITATSGSISASTTLTVDPATLTSIAVTPLTSALTNGSTQQFKATGTFSNSTTQDLTALATWSSSNTGVATISNAAGSNGLATAVGAGSAVISAAWGGDSATASLTVTAPTSVTLSWSAPTSYSNGTPLNPATDLSTYKIYYGTASGVYTQVVSVPNPGSTTVTQTLNLTPGTYYFVVSDVDTAGQESNYSNEMSTTI